MTNFRALYAGSLGFLACSIATLPFSGLFAQAGNPSFVVVETGRSYSDLQSAVRAIGGSRATIAIAPGTYRQCAVQESGYIRFQAQTPGTVIFDGKTCEGKAALVLRGNGAAVDGVIFRNMRVSDGNGAGIRLEQGDLSVSQSWFADSQQGILTGNDRGGRITIDKSTFSGLGTCENSAGCAHSLYIGAYGSFTVTNSRFERGSGGHYVKSRAASSTIRASSFDDSNGSGTNYMIDLPAGGTGAISNNWFVQGRDKENYSAFIAIGAEDLLHNADGLTIERNVARFVPGLSRNSAFVADWTGHQITLRNNAIASGIKRFESR